MGEERREYPRIRRRRKIGLILSDGSVEYLWTLDLSRGGMQVHTEHMVDVGASFGLVIGIYDEPSEGYITLRGKVQVMHKVYDGSFNAFRLGLQILSFEGDGMDIYLRHIRELEQQL